MRNLCASLKLHSSLGTPWSWDAFKHSMQILLSQCSCIANLGGRIPPWCVHSMLYSWADSVQDCWYQLPWSQSVAENLQDHYNMLGWQWINALTMSTKCLSVFTLKSIPLSEINISYNISSSMYYMYVMQPVHYYHHSLTHLYHLIQSL